MTCTMCDVGGNGRYGIHYTALASGLSLDPDGDVALDWSTPSGDLLSISIAPTGLAVFAWHRGTTRGSGSVQLAPEAFDILRAAT